SRVNAHGVAVWFTGRGSIVDEQVADRAGNPFGNGVRGRRGVDDDEAARLRDRHREKAVPDAPMECHVEAGLEPRPIAGSLAAKADLDGQIEEQGQVRLETTGGDVRERLQLGEREAAAVALVGAVR